MFSRKKPAVLGIKLDMVINSISLMGLKKGIAPSCDRLSRDWLAENSSVFETGVVYMLDRRDAGYFVTLNETSFPEDTPFELSAPAAHLEHELLLTATPGMLWVEYGGFALADISIDYWNKLLLGQDLLESNDPRKKMRGESFEDSFTALHSTGEFTVNSQKTLYPKAYTLKNSGVKLCCYSITSLNQLSAFEASPFG